MPQLKLSIEAAPELLEPLVQQVIDIANSEKEALGFIPHSAYPDAIKQRRILVALDQEGSVAGFLLHGGVFPHGRVQQVGVRSDLRRNGVASALLNYLIDHLEKDGFLTVKARVASDLAAAQQFYAKHGFESVEVVAGGEARGRTIDVRVRQLDTPSLLDAAGSAIHWDAPIAALSLRKSAPGETPFYAIDLNVLFDLVRNRSRSSEANHLFNAALAHAVRIAVAPEFIAELRRTSKDIENDVLLKLALQMPRLPKADDQELSTLSDRVHSTVFDQSGIPASDQSRSDARHVAHAALVGAAGFITSDGALLSAREDLREHFGLDIAGLDELVSLLPVQAERSPQEYYGEGFSCRDISASDAKSHLKALGVDPDLVEAFCKNDGLGRRTDRYAIYENDSAIAFGAVCRPATIDEPARVLAQVPQYHPSADLFAEHLLEVLLRTAAADRVAWLELSCPRGQTVISRVAKAKGFFPTDNTLSKIALGRPITLSNWEQSVSHLRRRLGLEFPRTMPSGTGVVLGDASGRQHSLSVAAVEELLGPTLLACPGRDGVIVSIERQYADELLGTSHQARFPFVESRPAAFLSRRAYVCSPRNAAVLQNGKPILFHESIRSGGRGAIVAAARVVDCLVQPKSAISNDSRRRLVVDDVREFSATDDVLVVSFDGILVFPRPFPQRELAKINAMGSSNLQAATPISADNLNRVLDAAWS